MIDCILTVFMKKMQCNALNIKTVAKQVWFYFIRGTTRPGYAGKNLQIVLNTPKNPYLNQATLKILAKIFLPLKILKWKISNLRSGPIVAVLIHKIEPSQNLE